MPISAGDKLPDATLKVMTPDGPDSMTTADIFAGKKVALFAVPGAFTPTCHARHVPSYLENLEALKAKGIDQVVCMAVNDPFVMGAWAKDTGADGKILFVSDWDAAFTKALGLEFDASAAGLGTRSRRFAMIVNDGVVEWVDVEEAPGTIERTSAEVMLQHL
ncbi:MAG: peroxiredoxin [Methyloligellaceae bacterium]